MILNSGLNPLYCVVGCSQNEGEDFALMIHLCVQDRVLIYQLGNSNTQITHALRRFLQREDVLFVTLRPKNEDILSRPPHYLHFPRKLVSIWHGLPLEEQDHTLHTLFERELEMVIPSLYNDMHYNWRAEEYTENQLILGSLPPYGVWCHMSCLCNLNI